MAQPVRRIPFSLRGKVENKIRDLLDKDVIDVEGATVCVSPVVVAPKHDGDIRFCINMWQANQAIEWECHPIPTVDEALQDMGQSKVFTKLDLNWNFHQLELHPDSRDITTFVTHCGLYRYKRLLFGVNAASEIYQNEIRKIVQGLPGVANIADDIIVHGRDQQEHDARLHKVLK